MISKIRAGIRVYGGPVLISVVTVLGVFWCFNLIPHHVDKHGRQRNAQLVDGMLGLTISALQGLSPQCDLQYAAAQRVLESIVANSVLRYAIVQKDGRNIIRTSQAPDTIRLPSNEGHQVEMGRFRYWRNIQLNCQNSPAMKPGRQAVKSKDINSELILILAGEIPKDQGIFVRKVKTLHFVLALVFLSATVCAVNWVMAINRKLKTEKSKNKLLRLKHLEELNMAAAGLAHETKNPLGLISAVAQQISRCPAAPADHIKQLAQIIDAVEIASARLDHFMNFARKQQINLKSIEASKLIGQVANVLNAEFEAIGVELVTQCPQIWIFADEKVVRQILVNLLLNSLQASFQGQIVSLRLSIHGDRAKLEVEDQGNGISDALLPNIFKPYVTGRSNGHGLGLAIVKRQVEEHGWTIQIMSAERKGTRATISGIKLKKQMP